MFDPSSFTVLPNCTEIAHAQPVPFFKQLLHIQYRLHVFGRLRKQMDAAPPRPTPPFSRLLTTFF
jgi:hypothetical protein